MSSLQAAHSQEAILGQHKRSESGNTVKTSSSSGTGETMHSEISTKKKPTVIQEVENDTISPCLERLPGDEKSREVGADVAVAQASIDSARKSRRKPSEWMKDALIKKRMGWVKAAIRKSI